MSKTKQIKIKKDDGTYEAIDIAVAASNVDGLATVATSGSYNDLSDKPESIDTSNKMDKANPTGTGSFSLNRVEDTDVGDYSIAEGDETEASGYASYAGNGETHATGDYSHAEGYDTTASGEDSHAEGETVTASGYDSHAEGWSTTASGIAAHAEGDHSEASGEDSHAEGYYVKASEKYSHAEGNHTEAKEESSHAEGYYTQAAGKYSHAEGYGSAALKESSHAEGFGTVANGYCQHTQGEHNIPDTTSIHIVGNGTDYTKQSNAHTLDWSGNAWFAGDVYTGSTSGTNKDDGSKKLATEDKIQNMMRLIGSGSEDDFNNAIDIHELSITFYTSDPFDAVGAVDQGYNSTEAKIQNTDFINYCKAAKSSNKSIQLLFEGKMYTWTFSSSSTYIDGYLGAYSAYFSDDNEITLTNYTATIGYQEWTSSLKYGNGIDAQYQENDCFCITGDEEKLKVCVKENNELTWKTIGGGANSIIDIGDIALVNGTFPEIFENGKYYKLGNVTLNRFQEDILTNSLVYIDKNNPSKYRIVIIQSGDVFSSAVLDNKYYCDYENGMYAISAVEKSYDGLNNIPIQNLGDINFVNGSYTLNTGFFKVGEVKINGTKNANFSNSIVYAYDDDTVYRIVRIGGGEQNVYENKNYIIFYNKSAQSYGTTYKEYLLPTASTTTKGGVKVDGTTITADNNGVISVASIDAVTSNIVSNIVVSDTDIIAGSALAEGTLYLVYEDGE